MKILGIDYGLKKIGLALSDGTLAQPYQILKIEEPASVFTKIIRICEEEKIEKIVIGLSENQMAQKTRRFGEELKEITGLPVVYQDETLTSLEAQKILVQIGKPKKKRQQQEDLISAALILQNYLDQQNHSSL